MNQLRIIAMGLLLAASSAHAGTQQELEQRVQALAEQLEAVKSELAQMKAQQAQAGALASAPPAVAPSAMASSPPSTPASVGNAAADTGISFFGYGEMNYSRPTGNAAATEVDLARFVLGIGYRFDENTRLVSELEVEHAIASADDAGEFEIEQAYIERRLRDNLFLKAGLFLIPSGFLNVSHEPTRYYGVRRNFIETAIIPSTWREGGVQLQGETDAGLAWNVGVSTGFNLNKWDAASEEGLESPLGAIHQELSLASGKDLSGFLALNYIGLPGVKVGASLFTGGASQGQTSLGSSRITLWEGHARWTPAQWELSALYARGRISNTAALNLQSLGQPTPIPQSFFGWYAEAAYRALERERWSLTPFLRYERFNTGASFADLGVGITPVTAADREVFTGGVNWMIAPGVVIKADYLNFRGGSGDNRWDLGLGYQF
jgi:hypothetical protein